MVAIEPGVFARGKFGSHQGLWVYTICPEYLPGRPGCLVQNLGVNVNAANVNPPWLQVCKSWQTAAVEGVQTLQSDNKWSASQLSGAAAKFPGVTKLDLQVNP